MAKPKKEGGPTQKLSTTGRKRKHDRDVCYAKGWVWNKDTGVCSQNGPGRDTSALQRGAKKNENQKLGQKSTSDIHHVNGSVGKTKRMSIKNNRGDSGDGTKNDAKQNK